MTEFGKGREVTGTVGDFAAAALAVQEFMDGPDSGPSPAPTKHTTLEPEALPRAGPPPLLSSWDGTCWHLDRKCRKCEICLWEATANRWHLWTPHREGIERRLSIRSDTPRPRFGHVDAALLAWFEWEMYGRTIASTTGVLLDLIEQGSDFSGPRAPKRDNSLLQRSDDIVHVELALVRAFARSEFSSALCRTCLLSRTHGALATIPTYDDIGEELGVPGATVKSVVKLGRRAVQIELAARGLVPLPSRASPLHHDIDVRRREILTQEPE